MKVLIRNGRVVDPASGRDEIGELALAEGRICESFAGKPERVIDAKGLVVAPGLIDLSARLREPGFEHKATLESEMDAAVAGGVTSLACPPDTDPPLDEPGLVDMLRRRAKALSRARVYPVGALTVKLAGERLTEMAELAEAGCVAFSQANAPLSDTQVLWRALQYAATFGFPVWLRAEDLWLARGGVAHDGDNLNARDVGHSSGDRSGTRPGRRDWLADASTQAGPRRPAPLGLAFSAARAAPTA